MLLLVSAELGSDQKEADKLLLQSCGSCRQSGTIWSAIIIIHAVPESMLHRSTDISSASWLGKTHADDKFEYLCTRLHYVLTMCTDNVHVHIILYLYCMHMYTCVHKVSPPIVS